MQDWKFLFFSLNFLLNSKFHSTVKWWIASLRIRIVSQHPLDILRLETFLSPLTNSEFEFKFPIIKKTFDGKSFSRRFARGTPSIRVEMKKLLNFLHHRRWCSSAYDFPYTIFLRWCAPSTAMFLSGFYEKIWRELWWIFVWVNTQKKKKQFRCNHILRIG